MQSEFKRIVRFTVFYLLIISPTASFAYYDGDYWDYHGSGRDQPYSAYIDRANYVGPADYSLIQPDYVDWHSYINNEIPLPLPAQQNEFIVNIPNSHGSYTPVIIKRSGTGYTGPQGEFYPQFPKVSQLKIMYGK